MSDGYSETAKTFWKGVRKYIEKAVERARPFGVYIHTPLTPWVRVAKLGDPQTVEQGTVAVLRPGQPLPGERAIAITLSTGEVLVLGSIREESDDAVVLVTSPLIWRRTAGDASPVSLEWVTPGFVRAVSGCLGSNHIRTVSFFNTNSLTTSSTTFVVAPGATFTFAFAGTYTLNVWITVPLSAGSQSNVEVRPRVAGVDGTAIPFVISNSADSVATVFMRATGVVYDGTNAVAINAYLRNINGVTTLLRNSQIVVLAERTA